ncbi:MAG: glutathione S-transferase C-terminal domain-containing protein [Nocardioides sp.]
MVTNDFPQITHDLFFEWREHHRSDAPDLWPADLRAEMDAGHEARLHRGEQRRLPVRIRRLARRPTTQAYDRLWAALDWLEERLAARRYLMGEAITEADVRLFTTLVRFDPVYHGHFKCNRQQAQRDARTCGRYARDLFQTPGFGDTVDFDQIKRHYYVVHTDVNPTGIVPKGPDLAAWLEPPTR